MMHCFFVNYRTCFFFLLLRRRRRCIFLRCALRSALDRTVTVKTIFMTRARVLINLVRVRVLRAAVWVRYIHIYIHIQVDRWVQLVSRGRKKKEISAGLNTDAMFNTYNIVSRRADCSRVIFILGIINSDSLRILYVPVHTIYHLNVFRTVCMRRLGAGGFFPYPY